MPTRHMLADKHADVHCILRSPSIIVVARAHDTSSEAMRAWLCAGKCGGIERMTAGTQRRSHGGEVVPEVALVKQRHQDAQVHLDDACSTGATVCMTFKDNSKHIKLYRRCAPCSSNSISMGES